MMMVSNIFGRARLPNHQRAFQIPMTNAALACDRKRRPRRAVGPARAKFTGPSFTILAKDVCSAAAAPLSSQRLGAFRGFGQMQGQHPSKISGKPHSRSGASPHQSSGGASPLMTITKKFVTYFKHPIVSL